MSIFIEWWKIGKKFWRHSKKCSLTSFHLQNLSTLEDNSNSDDLKKFTWNNIRDCYSERSTELNNLNVYQYCANHWVEGKQIIPQFFGYYDHPSWPLTEDYAKWTLILFKPWRISTENVKSNHLTYAAALMDYLFHDDFPQSKRYQILRAQRKEKPIDFDEGTFLGPDDNANDNEEDEDISLSVADDFVIIVVVAVVPIVVVVLLLFISMLLLSSLLCEEEENEAVGMLCVASTMIGV